MRASVKSEKKFGRDSLASCCALPVEKRGRQGERIRTGDGGVVETEQGVGHSSYGSCGSATCNVHFF